MSSKKVSTGAVQQNRRTNRLTGNPKKWLCWDNRQIDKHLDCIEILYSNWRSGSKQKLDSALANEMLESLQQMKDMIVSMSQPTKPLSCEPQGTEETDPADFWKDFKRN